MKCINGQLFTEDGAVEGEEWVKQLILNEIRDCITTRLHKRVSNLPGVIKLQAYSQPFPIETDRIHVANGIYYLDGRFIPVKHFCVNRLSVSNNPSAQKPVRWLRFLSEPLEPKDISTLQEYLGYCLILSTKGQKMMMILGQGGEGKSQIGLVLKAMLGRSMNTGSIQKVESNRFAKADLENRLLRDAKAGLFDFIITKEISRSTLDSIKYTQELLEYNVGVFFQNDNINTLDRPLRV